MNTVTKRERFTRVNGGQVFNMVGAHTRITRLLLRVTGRMVPNLKALSLTTQVRRTLGHSKTAKRNAVFKLTLTETNLAENSKIRDATWAS